MQCGAGITHLRFHPYCSTLLTALSYSAYTQPQTQIDVTSTAFHTLSIYPHAGSSGGGGGGSSSSATATMIAHETQPPVTLSTHACTAMDMMCADGWMQLVIADADG